MGSLTGKVAIVTGASKGIGAGIARRLGAAGAAVAVNYSSDRAGAQRVAAEIEQGGGKAVAVQGSVAREEDVERLFSEAKDALGGPLDILVNNAGVFAFQPIEQVTPDEFRRQFDTNVLGTLLATREASKHFGPEGGSVINVSSIVSTGRIPGSAIYSATKGAVDTLTRVLAVELAPRKIRVNAVAPGITETEGTTAAGMVGSEMSESMIAGIPLGRMGQPDDIAKAVLFLASDDSSWLTGEIIAASGGQRA